MDKLPELIMKASGRGKTSTCIQIRGTPQLCVPVSEMVQISRQNEPSHTGSRDSAEQTSPIVKPKHKSPSPSPRDRNRRKLWTRKRRASQKTPPTEGVETPDMSNPPCTDGTGNNKTVSSPIHRDSGVPDTSVQSDIGTDANSALYPEGTGTCQSSPD